MQPADVRHPHGKTKWRQQLAHAPAVGAGKEWREVIEDRVRDGAELEPVTQWLRRIGGEDSESLVLPPEVLGAVAVMRDVQPALAFAALEPSVAQKRAEDDLDLHRIRHDASKNALWMLPHTSYVGAGLLPI